MMVIIICGKSVEASAFGFGEKMLESFSVSVPCIFSK